MGLIKKMSEGMKRGIRSWLNIQDATPTSIMINEILDYEANAIKNRIWYRGDSNELSSFTARLIRGLIDISSGQEGAARVRKCVRYIQVFLR